MRLPRRHLAGTILLVAALLLVVALAACGSPASGDGIASANGGSATPSASAAANQTLSNADRARRFAQCMRDHGVDVTADQGTNGETRIRINGTQRAKVDAAARACQQYAPGSGGTNSRPDPAALERARRFAKCMREHGVSEFPDPDPSGGIKIESRAGSRLDPDNPTFQKAQQTCGSIMGGKLGTAGGPGDSSEGSRSGGDS